MPFDPYTAERVRETLARRAGFTEKKMFGGVAFLLNGNMCVGVWKEFLIARVGPKEYPMALEKAHVLEFDITGRPMRGWVMVEPEGMETEAALSAWIQTAIEFVGTLPAKRGH